MYSVQLRRFCSWRWRSRLKLALLLAMCSQATQAQSNSRIAEQFVVVEEPGTRGTVERQKLARCFDLLIEELHIDARELPTIVVYHISPKSAQHIGIDASSIYRNTGGVRVRYEMWIIGRPSSHTYSYLLANILTHHFHISMDDEARSFAIKQVERVLNGTRDVNSLR